jgi:hypothetical protein
MRLAKRPTMRVTQPQLKPDPIETRNRQKAAQTDGRQNDRDVQYGTGPSASGLNSETPGPPTSKKSRGLHPSETIIALGQRLDRPLAGGCLVWLLRGELKVCGRGQDGAYEACHYFCSRSGSTVIKRSQKDPTDPIVGGLNAFEGKVL